jgi:DNA-binding transcriptional LysR family regulator
MRLKMDHIARVGVFLAVAEGQGFSAAGRVLGMTASAISKHIQLLEEQLGVKLLHRTTRMVRLTDEGEIYYRQARQALDQLQEAERLIQERRLRPSGRLSVNLPMSFGTRYLRAPLAGFAREYPEISLHLSFDDRMVDMVSEGVDVAIRIGVLQDSTLIQRKLADCPIYLCASPDYLSKHAMPQHPDDLPQHAMILYNRHGAGNEWRWRHIPSGATGLSQLSGLMYTNTAEMMQEAALQVIGIANLPIFVAATYLESGQLVRVLPEYETHPLRQIIMLYHPGRQLSGKVRLFLDWMQQACVALPWGCSASNGESAASR